MKSISLIFGCHAHQPVGNFDFVFEQSYHKCYRPFLYVLEQYPAVRATLHFTGPLFDWFEENEPAFLDKLAMLVERGQVEIMGGGYYEPLLCAIPERDATAQIARMQEFCLRRFGKSPGGMWLTERVWEPHMASVLARAGVAYTALDDAHFLCSGLRPEDMFGYYMTEDEGQALRVFPISEKLRYLVPFHQVRETIDWLREHATEDGTRCAVLHDDYEKFGVWPGTNKSVYGEGWLEEFFQALTDNQDWLHCLTYEQYIERNPALGRAYITCASYDEMMTWALPTPMQRELNQARALLKDHEMLNKACAPFMRGGFWRMFLTRYAESNTIQKRMLRVSARLHRLQQQFPDDERLTEARRLLHQGQCNCAYWHGVFGGLYLNHLRTALFEKLIAAEQVMDAIEEKGATYVGFEAVDFDADGKLEAILDNAHLCLFLSPADGGALFELDYKTQPFNFGNVLTRRDEVYHDHLRAGKVTVGEEMQGDLSIHEMVKAKEANLDKLLVHDPWRRASLRDRVFAADATADTLWGCVEPELGAFATADYALETIVDGISLHAERPVRAASPVNARISKTIRLAAGVSHVDIEYTVCCDAPPPPELLFGIEFVVNLLTGDAPDRYYRSNDEGFRRTQLGTRGVANELNHIAARDDWQHVELGLHFSTPARVYRFPLDTVSQSEDGQERVHQGCVMIPCWPLEKEMRLGIRLEIRRTEE